MGVGGGRRAAGAVVSPLSCGRLRAAHGRMRRQACGACAAAATVAGSAVCSGSAKCACTCSGLHRAQSGHPSSPPKLPSRGVQPSARCPPGGCARCVACNALGSTCVAGAVNCCPDAGGHRAVGGAAVSGVAQLGRSTTLRAHDVAEASTGAAHRPSGVSRKRRGRRPQPRRRWKLVHGCQCLGIQCAGVPAVRPARVPCRIHGCVCGVCSD